MTDTVREALRELVEAEDAHGELAMAVAKTAPAQWATAHARVKAAWKAARAALREDRGTDDVRIAESLRYIALFEQIPANADLLREAADRIAAPIPEDRAVPLSEWQKMERALEAADAYIATMDAIPPLGSQRDARHAWYAARAKVPK